MARKMKRLDPLSRHMAKVVVNRPWLGWRHRHPIEQYAAARRRNALLQAGMNGGFLVFSVVTGGFVVAVLLGFFTYQASRNYYRLTKRPTDFYLEWQPIRGALTAADEARAAGQNRRQPSPLTMVVVPLAGVAAAALFKLSSPFGSWSTFLIVGAIVGLLLDVADFALHLFHAPKPMAGSVTAVPANRPNALEDVTAQEWGELRLANATTTPEARSGQDGPEPIGLGFVLGLLSIAGGFLAIGLAWYHAGNTDDLWIQNQEIISGGFAGVALVLLGSALLLTDRIGRTQAIIVRDLHLLSSDWWEVSASPLSLKPAAEEPLKPSPAESRRVRAALAARRTP